MAWVNGNARKCKFEVHGSETRQAYVAAQALQQQLRRVEDGKAQQVAALTEERLQLLAALEKVGAALRAGPTITCSHLAQVLSNLYSADHAVC